MRMTNDEYFMELVDQVAARSTCRRRAVGAILVDRERRILATGYNGVPKKFDHCTEQPCIDAESAPGSPCFAVHAEMNALIQCAERRDIFILYVSTTPCFECAKILANTALKGVIAKTVYTEPNDHSGIELLGNAGINIQTLGNYGTR